MVFSEMSTAVLLLRKLMAMYPPKMAPTLKMRFHRWAFQSNLKKSQALFPPIAAQRVLRFPDIPKLRPEKIKKNITEAISGPETYQGQGLSMASIIEDEILRSKNTYTHHKKSVT